MRKRDGAESNFTVQAFVNAAVYAFDPQARLFRKHDALAVDGTAVAALDRASLGAGVTEIDLEGATTYPRSPTVTSI